MLYKIIDNCYQNANVFDDPSVDFLLELDPWNDYSFRTTYHIHATSKLSKNGTRYLGPIKIMKKGQTTAEYYVLRSIANHSVFSSLPNNFVSVSFSLELYQAIVHLLQSKEKRNEFVKDLCLIFDKEDPRYKEYAGDECFNVSLLRDASIDNYILKKGKQLLYDEAVFYDLETKKITVTYAKADSPIELDFNPLPEVEGVGAVPYGVIAFIGQNGCGKSTFLYQLAKLLYLSPTDRFLIKDTVQIEPSDVGISKLFLFSYSAFDNFMFPGNTLADYRLMAEGVTNRDGRFVYCGVRNIVQEIDTIIQDTIKNNAENPDENNPIVVNIERVRNISLKALNVLAGEFVDALTVIMASRDKKTQWERMGSDCKIVLPEIFHEIEPVFQDLLLWDYDYEEAFLKYSTGIKFFLHTMSHIYAYNEDNSLLLFDEPENHLHPPMLSFMMNHIRDAIRHTHSVMLIATHSPVILQELFSRNVYVARRNGKLVSLSHPETETYGENFGFINNLVFRLNSDVSMFHDVFEALFEKWECRNCKNEEDVISLFQEKLKCNFLSSQMTAFLVNLYNSSKLN